MKMANLIESTLEEMRIQGKKPGYIGMTPAARLQLEEELKPLQVKDAPYGKIIAFMGLVIIPMDGKMMSKDGLYIPDYNNFTLGEEK